MQHFPFSHWGAAPAGGGGGGSTYVNSVQHVSITIPTGSTSATATISSVGSYAFILFGGALTSNPSNPHLSAVRVELTNATTVTAYRNSSSATYSVSMKCCVVDATSSLMASVQLGTVTIANSNTSGTATVSSTNSSYTVLHLMGFTSSQTSLAYPSLEPFLSLSGTTLTASRITSAANSVTAAYAVLEFNSSACNQAVQVVQKNWTNTTGSSTQSITSVDPNNTILFHAGSAGNSNTNSALAKQYATLTNGTTITFNTYSTGSNSCYYNLGVVELASGILNSSVQRGVATMNAASTGSSTVSSVTTGKTLLSPLHMTSNQTSANFANVATNIELSSSTSIGIARQNSINIVNYSWELAEFA